MFKKLLVIAALATVPCFGAYDPKGSFFIAFEHKTGKGYFPRLTDINAHLVFIMKNVPLYFTEKNNSRDYINSIQFSILKLNDGTYNLFYAIKASRHDQSLDLKHMQPQKIDTALKDTFPNVFDTTTDGKFKTTIDSLYALKHSECNRDLFDNLTKFINHMLPVDKLHFDENDLSISEKPTGWRAWLNWLRGE